MTEPLFPADARTVYGELVARGTLLLPADDPRWLEPGLNWLFRMRLVGEAQRATARVAPTVPAAAFERLLTRQRQHLDDMRSDVTSLMATVADLQQRFLRTLPMAAMNLPCQVITDHAQVSALFDSLSQAGAHDVRNWIAGPYFNPELVGPTPPADSRLGYLPPNADMLGRGGRARSLYEAAHVEAFPADLRDAFADGEEIRTIDKLPMKLLVVDDHSALVPLRPYGPPALLVRDRSLVSFFRMFFELVWNAAVPWPASDPTAANDDHAMRRQVLTLLAEGHKDEAIARRLGVSARTVRRQVAEIMRELGVTTRFAAGVAAVRAGLLDSP